MDLEKFIEEDIKNFLDQKAEEQANEIPEEVEEKKYEVPDELLERREEEREKEREKEKAEKEKEEDSELLKREEEKKERIKEEIYEGLEKIDNLLDKKEKVGSIYLYKHLKSLFQDIPGRFYDEKKELYDKLITAYYEIKNSKRASPKKEEPPESWSEEQQSQDGEEAEAITEPGQEITSSETDTGVEEGYYSEEPEEEVSEEPEISGEESPDEEGSGEGEEERESPTKEDLLRKMEDVKDLIQTKEARRAAEEYEELKVMFEAAEEDHEVSEEIFKDILSIRKSLRELEEHEVERKQRAPPEDVIEQEEEGLSEKVEREREKAYKFLDNGEVKSAVRQYNKLRDMLSEMSIDDIELKEQLKDDMMRLHDDILDEQKKDFRKDEPEMGSGEIWDEISQIRHMIDSGELMDAKEKFIEVQKMTSDLDKEERKEVYKALDSIKSKLHLAHAAESMERVAA